RRTRRIERGRRQCACAAMAHEMGYRSPERPIADHGAFDEHTSACAQFRVEAHMPVPRHLDLGPGPHGKGGVTSGFIEPLSIKLDAEMIVVVTFPGVGDGTQGFNAFGQAQSCRLDTTAASCLPQNKSSHK